MGFKSLMSCVPEPVKTQAKVATGNLLNKINPNATSVTSGLLNQATGITNPMSTVGVSNVKKQIEAEASKQPSTTETTPEQEETPNKRYLCKYKVHSLVIKMGEDKIELDPTNVLSIEYLNDYEYNIMALLKLTIRIDIRKKLWILKNKKDITVQFALDKVGVDSNIEDIVTSEEEAWNLCFGVYFTDEDEAIDVETMEERLTLNEGNEFSTDTIDEENYFESQNSFELFLFHPLYLAASRFSFNRVYTEATLQNIVAEMLDYSGHDDVLMSKFENDEIYEELLVPVNPVYKNLIYLDQYFGFYRKGALIYYDIDTLYILNTNGKVTAKREDEWTETTFIIPPLNAAMPGNGMIRAVGENKYYPTVTESEINPQKFSIGKNVELGSAAKIVVTDDTTINLEEAEQSFIDQRNETVLFTKKFNKYTGEVLRARMEENDCVLYISGNNLDVNAFRPNKTFRVVFDDPVKHGRFGKNEYRISYAYHFIKMESESFMSSSHRIILKKTDGPEIYDDEDDE